MRGEAAEQYRCPVCRRPLTVRATSGDGAAVSDGELLCPQHGSYAIRDGIPDFIDPRELAPSDEEFRTKYDAGAEAYDSGIQWMWQAFHADEDAVRESLVDLLELEPGMRVLETGCGTGNDSARIVRRIGGAGTLFAQDLSRGMLAVAAWKLAASDAVVEFHASNGAYLPFADDAFDAAYHFGGINTFGERRRALAEMARVVRPGGKVVVGDEGIAPWQRRKRIGRILVNANPLYAHTPPVVELPEIAENVRLQWIIGNAFYVIDYRVGTGPPPVDLDLPIPGRGDTLRTRYERANPA